jgi:hypothetical protein
MALNIGEAVATFTCSSTLELDEEWMEWVRLVCADSLTAREKYERMYSIEAYPSSLNPSADPIEFMRRLRELYAEDTGYAEFLIIREDPDVTLLLGLEESIELSRVGSIL